MSILDIFVIYNSHLCCHITRLKILTVNISPKLIMTQTCNYKLYYQKIIDFFSEDKQKRAKNVLQREYIILRPYIKLLTSEMKLRVLNIDVLLIKVSITDGRRLVLPI